MPPRELFGLAVRLVGFLALLAGGWRLYEWLMYFLGISNMLVVGVRSQCIFLLAVGLGSLLSADAIVKLTYPSGDGSSGKHLPGQ
jgi:hypothetical protein